MKTYWHIYGALFILFATIGCKKASFVNVKELHTNWQFKKADDSEWKNATVPGTVHTDLLANKEIKDPFYRLNEHDVQWIDKEDWEYKTNFSVTEEELSNENIELEFKGLDTYAKIFVNDSLILETDNMFRSYKVDVKPYVKKETNELRVLLISPIKEGIKKHDAIDYNITVSDNDLAEIGKVEENKKVSIFSRKAGYHFGWDWGPRLVTSGIWRPVILRSWNSFKIDDVFIQQKSIDTKASLNAKIALNVNKPFEKSTIEVFVNNQPVKKEEHTLKSGMNSINIPFEIENPELWWPNGMGKQHLYNVDIKISADKHSDSFSHKVGLRTVELITEKDSIGSSFYFKVNGKPTFMKGANYIPQDIFLPRVDKSNYEHILQSAKDANMNMIRVWGGGVYEHQDFYKLCDEKGLLVWQDFMFACAMYPGDDNFLESVKQEAIDNVKRLRNHTSIALWCGNNEVLSAWERWGWKQQTEEKQSKEKAEIVWKAYTDIFHKVLPEVVEKYDADRRYWASSPSSELGVPESHTDGDAHYWGVWWGKEPFENYNVKIPRFMSEFGFQSFPELSTVNKYALPEDHDIFSEVMKSHQRSSIGNGTIEEYMLRHYKKPKDFESFLYVSHLLQAYGISTGIEAHRKNRARCMGSLYWQINDCWPVASWSSIDYFGKWKALHYGVKKSFKKTIVSFDKQEDDIAVVIATDSLQDLNTNLTIQLLNFNGEELKSWKKDILVKANSSETYIKLSKKELDLFKDKFNNSFLQATLSTNNNIIDDKQFFIVPFKELVLPDPEISFSVTENNDSYSITIENKKLAIGVFAAGNFDENFSDNYFNLLPNTQKTIKIKKGNYNTISDFKNALKVMSLVDSYKDDEL
ncbi:beta-mannosidase [Tenacibaculum sp. M341]|uniref:beta-mannosidase n=1 Tax=Tenacibaculum sp. M341 TaxID=2530339 RepID=UPI00105369E1|nr:glycoside hydrolase family 2 protein [Tenacibaculum sp. M341]TCI85404.1 glycoside hydrolase family 2 protein [Tenacibaculum sp. M341]